MHFKHIFVLQILRQVLSDTLPDDIHERATGKAAVAITRLRPFTGVVVDQVGRPGHLYFWCVMLNG